MKNNQITENKDAIHVQICRALCKELNIQYYNGNLYTYSKGVYTNDISLIDRKIIQLYHNSTKNNRKEVKDYLETIKKDKVIEPDANYINFKNGLFDIKNKKLIPHTSKIFTINQINSCYLDNCCTNYNVEKFLNDVSSNNPKRKTAILQIIGYCLTSSVALQIAFIFYGETAENGKSTLLEIINRIIGRENISHVSIHDLQKSRFCSSELKNKLLNSVAELPRNNLESVEVFKAVVTGDVMSVEEKYKDRYEIRPYAKHIFTANELPNISDKSNGFYRRINILKFDAKFSDEEKKNFHIEQLLTNDAINYLTKISLEAYLELLETRHFANEEESLKLIEEYKNANNTTDNYLHNSDNFKNFIKNLRNPYI